MIIYAVYSLLGNDSSSPLDPEIVSEHANVIFERFDRLHQGYITIQDFVGFCSKVKYLLGDQCIDILFSLSLLGSHYYSID